MIKRSYEIQAQQKAFEMFLKAGVPIRDEEKGEIAIVDFGLDHFTSEGMHLFTLVSTNRYAAKALALLPWQTEPEHWHPPIGDDPGKQETVRVLWGVCNFYVPGDGEITHGRIPEGKDDVYTCRKELVLYPGDQLTLEPGQKHWFQGAESGTVLYTFSSTAHDILDGFSDESIQRETQYINDLGERP